MIKNISKKQILIAIFAFLMLLLAGLTVSDYYRQVRLQYSVEEIRDLVDSMGYLGIKDVDLNECTSVPVGYTSMHICQRGFSFRIKNVTKHEVETKVSSIHETLRGVLVVSDELYLGNARNRNAGGARYLNIYSATGKCDLFYHYVDDKRYADIDYACDDTSVLASILDKLHLRDNI